MRCNSINYRFLYNISDSFFNIKSSCLSVHYYSGSNQTVEFNARFPAMFLSVRALEKKSAMHQFRKKITEINSHKFFDLSTGPLLGVEGGRGKEGEGRERGELRG